MVVRIAVLVLVLGGTSAMAEDKSPWFGSQASEATQINASAAFKTGQTAQTKNALSVSKTCPPDGCPPAAKPAKYNN